MKNKGLSLICKDIVAIFKDYNLKRHYCQNLASTFDVYNRKCRKNKVAELKKSLGSQQTFFKRIDTQNYSGMKTSYIVPNIIAK